jgi:hypothetical protein
MWCFLGGSAWTGKYIDGSAGEVCLVAHVLYTGAASLDDIRVGVLKTLEAYSGVINLQGIIILDG